MRRSPSSKENTLILSTLSGHWSLDCLWYRLIFTQTPFAIIILLTSGLVYSILQPQAASNTQEELDLGTTSEDIVMCTLALKC